MKPLKMTINNDIEKKMMKDELLRSYLLFIDTRKNSVCGYNG